MRRGSHDPSPEATLFRRSQIAPRGLSRGVRPRDAPRLRGGPKQPWLSEAVHGCSAFACAPMDAIRGLGRFEHAVRPYTVAPRRTLSHDSRPAFECDGVEPRTARIRGA